VMLSEIRRIGFVECDSLLPLFWLPAAPQA
jgi:hypothetical protein